MRSLSWLSLDPQALARRRAERRDDDEAQPPVLVVEDMSS